MALDPNIILHGTRGLSPLDVSGRVQSGLQTVGIFQQMRNEQELAPLRKSILEGQSAGLALANQQRQAEMLEATRKRDLRGLANSYLSVKSLIDAGKYKEAADKLAPGIEQSIAAGQTVADMSDSIQAEETLRSGNAEDIALLQRQGEAIVEQARFEGLVPEDPAKLGRKGQARGFAPQKDPETGEFFAISFDPNTESFTKQVIPGAKGLTKKEEIQMEAKAREDIAKLDLSKTQQKELIKQRVARSGEIRSELADRNRSAARSQTLIQDALFTVANASEGLTATIKTSLARLLPGVDVSDEGALDSVLKRLALEQLQQFKGPTTDFEFNVTQQIVGQLGDPRSANIARLKSLSRNNWFMARELEQFNKFMKGGGDPDQFAFDFDEKITTKKGSVSLKNLQDVAVQNNMTIEEVINRLDK